MDSNTRFFGMEIIFNLYINQWFNIRKKNSDCFDYHWKHRISFYVHHNVRLDCIKVYIRLDTVRVNKQPFCLPYSASLDGSPSKPKYYYPLCDLWRATKTYWQASHSGSSIKQAFSVSMDEESWIVLTLDLTVFFSTCVAPKLRK